MRHRKDSLTRRLALEKLMELRASGMSYGQVIERYGRQQRRMCRERWRAGARSSAADEASRAAAKDREFLKTLDALAEGLAFFDRDGALVHQNAAMKHAQRDPAARREIAQFVASLRASAAMRAGRELTSVEELATRAVPLARGRCRLRGSYVGIDLFGVGGTLLLVLEPPTAADLGEDELRERFGLTRQEVRIARLLADGRSNEEIARELFISPHTARTHVTRVLEKLSVRSRAAVARAVRA